VQVRALVLSTLAGGDGGVVVGSWTPAPVLGNKFRDLDYGSLCME
jgi:hypothetical protein